MDLPLNLLAALLLPLPTDGGNLAPDWYQPPMDFQRQLQLQREVNTGYDVDLYVVDTEVASRRQ